MTNHNIYIWANRFNKFYGKKQLPANIFMTDYVRLPNAKAVIKHLPRKSMVIIRDYDMPDRINYAREITKLSRLNGHTVLIANDIALARQCRADGVHFPEWNLSGAVKCKSQHPFLCVSVAIHSLKKAALIEKHKLDFCLLSPVFATLSHPGASSLGVSFFRKIARYIKIPVYPLGGIDQATISQLKTSVVPGISAIGAYGDYPDINKRLRGIYTTIV